MDLQLKDRYTLSELMGAVLTWFNARQIRQFDVVFHAELTYSLQYTDARTNRFRYTHIVDGAQQALFYCDSDKLDQAIVDFQRDVRACLTQLQVAGPGAISSITVKIFPYGEKISLNLKSMPGSYVFVKA